jgi:PAS domain S-box-containing protein
MKSVAPKPSGGPMRQRLNQFIFAERDALLRRIMAALYRTAENRGTATDQELRQRMETILAVLAVWLVRGDFKRHQGLFDPIVEELVVREVPLGRVISNLMRVKEVLLLYFALHAKPGEHELQHATLLLERFFKMLVEKYSRTYSEQQMRMVREAQTRHDSFFQNIAYPAFLTDTAGLIQAANRALGEFRRCPPEALIGQPLRNIFCQDADTTQDFERLLRKLKRQDHVDQFALCLRDSTGAIIHTEISLTQRRDLDGRLIGLQGHVEDVTRRVLSEGKVEEQRRMLQAIFDHVPMGMVYLDPDSRIQFANRSFVSNLGFAADNAPKVIGVRLADNLDQIATFYKDAERYKALMQRVLAEPRHSEKEEFDLIGGRVIELDSRPVFNARREVQGRLTINRDLTYERELEKLRDALTHMIIHDLKNPLTSITMSASLLRSLMTPTELERYETPLRTIANGSATMLSMIMNLLDIARLEENKLELKHEAVGLHALIEEMRPALTALAAGRQLLLPRRPRQELTLQLDRGIIRRVIENIVSNAAKHTRPQGCIRLSLRKLKDGAILSIHDNGEGIAQEDLKRIFEKFGQAESRRLGHKTDTGLGLTFCKLAVEAHGGTIAVKSELGVGTEFQIRLR